MTTRRHLQSVPDHCIHDRIQRHPSGIAVCLDCTAPLNVRTPTEFDAAIQVLIDEGLNPTPIPQEGQQ